MTVVTEIRAHESIHTVWRIRINEKMKIHSVVTTVHKEIKFLRVISCQVEHTQNNVFLEEEKFKPFKKELYEYNPCYILSSRVQ